MDKEFTEFEATTESTATYTDKTTKESIEASKIFDI